MHGGVRLDGEEALGGDRAGVAHPLQIVAHEVDDHHVLRALLRALDELPGRGGVLGRVGGARPRPLDGLGAHDAVRDVEVEEHPGLPAVEPRRCRAFVDKDRECSACAAVEELGDLPSPVDPLGRAAGDGGCVGGDPRVRCEQPQQGVEVALAGGCHEGVDDRPVSPLRPCPPHLAPGPRGELASRGRRRVEDRGDRREVEVDAVVQHESDGLDLAVRHWGPALSRSRSKNSAETGPGCPSASLWSRCASRATARHSTAARAATESGAGGSSPASWSTSSGGASRQGKSLLRITPTGWGPIATGGFPPEHA